MRMSMMCAPSQRTKKGWAESQALKTRPKAALMYIAQAGVIEDQSAACQEGFQDGARIGIRTGARMGIRMVTRVATVGWV